MVVGAAAAENIQRKITPWKDMLQDIDLAAGGSVGGASGCERAAARERAHPDLIVIASLVDRLPNLGRSRGAVQGVNVFIGKYAPTSRGH